MKKYKILITEPLPEIEIGFRLLEDIAEISYSKEFLGEVSTECVRDIDAILVGDSRISRKTLEEAEKLKIVARHGVGVDNVDLEACTEKRIIVTNVRVTEGPSVPEHVFALILAISKKLISRDKMVREGYWNKRDKLVANELQKKTIGIIGLGNIGIQIANIARVFDMNVLTSDPYVTVENAGGVGAKKVDLETLLKKSDYISINCPLTSETRGLIGEKEFKVMKNTSIIVNTARGAIVDENELYQVLKNKQIAGAGIDVLENEPVLEHPLFELNNVIFTPHSAAFTVESLRKCAKLACENIRKVLDGELPENIVNKEVLKWL